MGYRREVPYRGGGVVAAADRQRRDTIPCLPRYACSRHPHQNPHPHSSTHQSINQSIGQALLLTQSSQSRQIESYRVRGAASLHHAARRSLKSPPGGLAHLSLPVLAALPFLRRRLSPGPRWMGRSWTNTRRADDPWACPSRIIHRYSV